MEIKFEVDARMIVAVEEILYSVYEEIIEKVSNEGFYPRFDGSIGVGIKKIKVLKSDDIKFLLTLACEEKMCICKMGNSEDTKEFEVNPQETLGRIFKSLGFFQSMFE
jgi:hypothetical protein